MRRLLVLAAATAMLAAACGDDGDTGSTAAFCDLLEEATGSEDLPPPEAIRALVDAAPSEIADDVERVGEVSIELSEADPDALNEAIEATQDPEFQESSEAIDDFSREECGIDPLDPDPGAGDDTGAGDDAAGDGAAGDDTAADDFDFDLAGVPGPSIAEAADAELDGHSFRGGIVNEGVDSLQLYVNDLTEQEALEICQRVAEHVAHHPEADGEGELAVGSGAETEGETVLVETTVSPGDPGSCERS